MHADANFLLRAVESGSSTASRRARQKLAALRQADEQLRVSAATVHEVVYVLESERLGYGWHRSDIGAVLRSLIEESALEAEEGGVISSAVDSYSGFGKGGPDFHDCYLAHKAMTSNTKVVSFDKDLDRLGVRETP